MHRGQGQFFAPAAGIATNAFYVFENLREKHYLQGLPFDDFTSELALFYDQLNFIHPFREGNGRTQRLYWSRVASRRQPSSRRCPSTRPSSHRASGCAWYQRNAVKSASLGTW